MTILVLTDATASDYAVGDAVATVKERLGSDPGVHVVSARDAFLAYQGAAGGVIRGHRWVDWVTHACTSFGGFVRVGNRRLGRVNADILTMALSMGRGVAYIEEDGAVYGIVGIAGVDTNDYKQGWLVVTR
jgi:hypothetical protein